MDAGKRRLFDLHSLKAKSSPRSSPWTAENKIRHRAQSVIVEDKEMVNVHNALLDTMEATRKSNEWSSIIPEVILVSRSASLKRILNSPFGLLLTRLGLLLALFGYQTHHHVTRLSFVTIGNVFVPLMLQRLWWLTESLDRSRKIYLHLLGYLLLLVLRVSWLTSDPICSSDTFTYSTIIVCTAASVYLFFSDVRIPDYDAFSKTAFTRRELHKEKKALSIAVLNPFVVATMFGSMLFVTNWLYGEVSVLASITGVSLPYRGGVVVMLALCTGLAIISDKRHLVGHPVWRCIGVGSGLLFCLLPSSRAFAAGCCFALFCMSLWPHVFECVLHHLPSPLLSIAMGTYLLLIMIHASVTGHDYIPGVSALFSGRPIILMSFVLVAIMLGIQKRWVPTSSQPQQLGPVRRKSRNSYVSLFGSVWRRLSTVSEEASSDENSGVDDAFDEDEVISPKVNLQDHLQGLMEIEYKSFLSVVRQVTVMMFLATIFGLMLQSVVPAVPSENTNNGELSVVVWSAKFGYTSDGRLDLSQAVILLNATGADIIVITECDTFHPVFGSYHLIQWLAKLLDMFSVHSDIIHTTGLGVISRHPIINTTHQWLPVKEGLHVRMNITVNTSGSPTDMTFVKPRYHWQYRINCSQLYTNNTPVVEETSDLSHMAMVHFAFCQQDISFHVENVESIPVSKKESNTGYIVLYKNLIRLCHIDTGQLVVVLFKIPQYGNHSNNLNTGSHMLFWKQFLDRFFSDRQQEFVTCF